MYLNVTQYRSFSHDPADSAMKPKPATKKLNLKSMPQSLQPSPRTNGRARQEKHPAAAEPAAWWSRPTTSPGNHP